MKRFLLIFIVNMAGFGIILETHLQTCMWACFQKAGKTMLWTNLPGQREKEAALCFLAVNGDMTICLTLLLPQHESLSEQCLLHWGCILNYRSISPLSLSCFCIVVFNHINEKSNYYRELVDRGDQCYDQPDCAVFRPLELILRQNVEE